jgi:hypothetical protein
MNKICLSKKSKFYSFEKEKRNYPIFFYFIEREREKKSSQINISRSQTTTNADRLERK